MEYVTLINVDENGFMIGPVEVDLLDENGNKNPLLDSPYLISERYASDAGFYTPRWDFENKIWYEGEPDKKLALVKENKKRQFKSEANIAIESGFEYDGSHFFFDKDAQLDFTMQLTYITAGLAEGENYEWKTMDGSVKMFNKEQFFQICQAANNHYRQNKGALWKLEVYIDNLTSLDELNSLGDFETAKQLVNKNLTEGR